MPYILAQTSTSGSICLAELLLAGERREPAGQPARRLPDQERARRRSTSSRATSRRATSARARCRPGRRERRDGRRQRRTSRSARPTSPATSARSRPRKPDTVIDILVGSDETAFYKQFKTDPRSNGHQDGELPDGRRQSPRRSAQKLLKGTVVSTGYFGQPEQGQPAVRRRDEEEVRRQGADLRRRGRGLGRRLDPRPRAQEGEVDVRQRRHRGADERESYSGPRGDLAFKGKHYVSLAMFLISVQKDGKAKLVGKRRGSRRSRRTRPAVAAP